MRQQLIELKGWSLKLNSQWSFLPTGKKDQSMLCNDSKTCKQHRGHYDMSHQRIKIGYIEIWHNTLFLSTTVVWMWEDCLIQSKQKKTQLNWTWTKEFPVHTFIFYSMCKLKMCIKMVVLKALTVTLSWMTGALSAVTSQKCLQRKELLH